MAKTRLTAEHRAALTKLAKTSVKGDPELLAKFDSIRSKAESLVRAALLNKFPPKDMLVLAKCEKSAIYMEFDIRPQSENSSIVRFEFESQGVSAPKGSYSRSVYYLGETVGEAVLEYGKAKTALEDDKKVRIKAYDDFIKSARTIEAVLAVWPEAKSVIGTNTLPVSIVDASIQIIKADIASRTVRNG